MSDLLRPLLSVQKSWSLMLFAAVPCPYAAPIVRTSPLRPAFVKESFNSFSGGAFVLYRIVDGWMLPVYLPLQTDTLVAFHPVLQVDRNYFKHII
jgi:hypothetical protein